MSGANGRTGVAFAEPRWGGLALALAALQVLLSWVSPTISMVYGAFLIGLLLLAFRADFLPALVVTQLSAADFFIGESFSEEAYSGRIFATGTLMIAGLPFTLPMFLGLLLPIVIVLRLVSVGPGFLPRNCRPVLLLWFLALIPSAMVCYWGYLLGNPSWTVPFRCALYAGGLFYGVVLAQSFLRQYPDTIRLLFLLITALMPLAAAGFFYNRILFVFVATCPPLAAFAWSNYRSGMMRLAVVTAFLSTAIFALGLGRSIIDIEGGALGRSGSTFTLNGLFVLSSLLVLGFYWSRRFSQKLRWLGVITFGALAGLTIVVALNGPSYRVGMTSYDFRVDAGGLTFGDRLRTKLFDDRSVIWEGALRDVLTPPISLKPSGRTFTIEYPGYGNIDWRFGAHNTFLEQLRQNGLWVGLLLLFILALALHYASAALHHLLPPVRALAIGIIPTATVGAFTGQYIFTESAGVWVLCIGGICWGLSAVSWPPSRVALRRTGP